MWVLRMPKGDPSQEAREEDTEPFELACSDTPLVSDDEIIMNRNVGGGGGLGEGPAGGGSTAGTGGGPGRGAPIGGAAGGSAPTGRGGRGPPGGRGGPPGGLQMAQLVAALNQLTQHNRMSIPQFSGQPHEDPAHSQQKALDYMEDAQIPPADRPQRFRMCLTGEARDWYNDIVIPAQWDDLMEMFCQRFCIFSQTEEQWHDAWQKLTFDKVNGNIDQFLS